jgi:hypothetical protein
LKRAARWTAVATNRIDCGQVVSESSPREVRVGGVFYWWGRPSEEALATMVHDFPDNPDIDDLRNVYAEATLAMMEEKEEWDAKLKEEAERTQNKLPNYSVLDDQPSSAASASYYAAHLLDRHLLEELGVTGGYPTDGLTPNYMDKVSASLLSGKYTGDDPLLQLVSVAACHHTRAASTNIVVSRVTGDPSFICNLLLILYTSATGGWKHSRYRVSEKRRRMWLDALFGDSMVAPPATPWKRVWPWVGHVDDVLWRHRWIHDLTYSGAASTDNLLVADMVVMAVREWYCSMLTMNRVVYTELCHAVQWRAWQQAVFNNADMWRVKTDGCDDLLACPDELPKVWKLVLRAMRKPIYEVLDKAMRDLLVKTDVSETSECAVFTEEMEFALRSFCQYAKYPGGAHLRPTSFVPPPNASYEEVQADYVQHNYFPIRWFHATQDTAQDLEGVLTLYERNQSSYMVERYVSHLAERDMFQFQVVAAFVRLARSWQHIQVVALPTTVVRAQARALRRVHGIPPTHPISMHLLTAFVCTQCDRFCGFLCGPDVKDKEAGRRGMARLNISFHVIEDRVERARAKRGHQLPTVAELPRTKSLFDWWAQPKWLGMEADVFPLDFSNSAAQPITPKVMEKAAFLLEPPPTYEPVSVPEQPPAPRERFNPMMMDSGSRTMVTRAQFRYEDILQRRLGNKRVVGHTSSSPGEQSIMWVCGSNKSSSDLSDVRKEGASEQQIADALTAAERDRAVSKQAVSRRKHMFNLYTHAQCSDRLVTEVNLFGRALLMHDEVYMACCYCLTWMKLRHAHCVGELLLCMSCNQSVEEHGHLAEASAYAQECIYCRTRAVGAEHYTKILVWDDVSVGNESFRQIYLCGKHARTKKWMLLFPNVPCMSAILHGLHARWKSPKSWHVNADYLNSFTEVETMVEFPDPEEEEITRKAPKRARVGGALATNKNRAVL